MKKKLDPSAFFFVLILIGILMYVVYSNMNYNTILSFTDGMLKEALKDNEVLEVQIIQNQQVPTGTVQVTFKDGTKISYYTSDVNETQKMVEKNADNKVPVLLHDVKGNTWLERMLPYIFAFILVILFLSIFGRRVQRGGGQDSLSNFGKSRAKKDLKTGICFDDVAGLEEEKQELKEIVDFLKDPKKYTDIGARIPKGVILVGPPGTGKTLLAKAVSGEAGVPFFSISGSDFVEMFVGVGAARVRDLFSDAKKNAPCIVFIDEIDAVARRRGTGLGGGNDEKEQTLNQLLVEMDGFGKNSGIIVMAATNRVDILDPAILRPGRFDRKVTVSRPDVKGREEILKVHAKAKSIGEDVNLAEIARTTSGFAGADLENLLNEAAIFAAADNRAFITKADIDRSFIKIGIGTEKKSRLVPEKDRRLTAYHEAGHAILFHDLSEMDPVYAVSIIPTGADGVGGFTMPLPGNDNAFRTKTMMMQNIMVSYGGRIAEELMLNEISTGASADIRSASQIARAMVTKYGFSEKLGPINYETDDSDQVFLGRELGHERYFGAEISKEIDAEVKRIINECYEEAKKILISRKDILEKCATLLLAKERISGEEFNALFDDENTVTSENTYTSESADV